MTDDLGRTPNLTIILPGSCQASCDFCYWKQQEASRSYRRKLKEALSRLPAVFSRVTITGGEPTLSPDFQDILDVVNQYKWAARVLTTNGGALAKHSDVNIDHINLSRHHYDARTNTKIFRTKKVPTDRELRNVIEKFNMRGIDTTLNAVLAGQFEDQADIFRYIEMAKDVGASAVMFRADQRRNSVDPPDEMQWFDHYRVLTAWSCPACSVWGQRIMGVPVYWKSGVPEPSNKTQTAYELIFHPNGRLTTDWAGANEYDFDSLDASWDDILARKPKEIGSPENPLDLGEYIASVRAGGPARLNEHLTQCSHVQDEPQTVPSQTESRGC